MLCKLRDMRPFSRLQKCSKHSKAGDFLGILQREHEKQSTDGLLIKLHSNGCFFSVFVLIFIVFGHVDGHRKPIPSAENCINHIGFRMLRANHRTHWVPFRNVDVTKKYHMERVHCIIEHTINRMNNLYIDNCTKPFVIHFATAKYAVVNKKSSRIGYRWKQAMQIHFEIENIAFAAHANASKVYWRSPCCWIFIASSNEAHVLAHTICNRHSANTSQIHLYFVRSFSCVNRRKRAIKENQNSQRIFLRKYKYHLILLPLWWLFEGLQLKCCGWYFIHRLK